MRAEVFWIPDEMPGRIGITTRPRGGDWLKDEMRALRVAGTDLLVSMLTPDEARELQLEKEEELCQEEGMSFRSVPIPDRGVPSTSGNVVQLAGEWAKLLENGTNIVVHCRQGIGRSAVMVASVLVTFGEKADVAFQIIAKTRGRPVPDTEEQRTWVEQFAASLHVATKSRVAEQLGRYGRAPNAGSEPGEDETSGDTEQAQQSDGPDDR